MTYYDTVTIVSWYSGGMAVFTDMVRANNEDEAAGLACEINECFEQNGTGELRDVIVLGRSSQYWD